MDKSSKIFIAFIPISIFSLIIYFAFFAPKELFYENKAPKVPRTLDYHMMSISELIDEKDQRIIDLEQTEQEFLEFLWLSGHYMELDIDLMTKYQIMDKMYQRIRICVDWSFD